MLSCRASLRCCHTRDTPSGRFKVRALTRKASSEEAKKLIAQGAEVVEGDFANASSLRTAFKGAWGLFHVTQSFGIVFLPSLLLVLLLLLLLCDGRDRIDVWIWMCVQMST